MQFEDNQVVLFHGVVDLRKGASGLMALVDDPKVNTPVLSLLKFEEPSRRV